MNIQYPLLCICAVLSTVWSDTPLNPRGARPIEPGLKADKCDTAKSWPFCTDEDWGRKCPSGCRIQGLIDEADHDLNKKIERIRNVLNVARGSHRNADQVSKQTYNFLRDRLSLGSDNENKFAALADQLRQRIVEMKIKIDRQLRMLETLKADVRNQVIAMQRQEVDLDIKIRSCKGSCASSTDFSVDSASYVALGKQLDHLDAQRVQSVETVSSLRVVKKLPIQSSVVSSEFRSGPVGQKTFFGDLKQMQFSLEAEGSTAESAATVSKVTTGMGSPSSSQHVTSQTLHCTKTVRKVTTQTKDGVEEKYEVVGGDGPGCKEMGSLGLDTEALISAAKEGKELKGDGFTVHVSSDDGKSITSLNQGENIFGSFGAGGDFFKGFGDGNHKFSSSSSSSSSSSFVSQSSKTTSGGPSKSLLSDTKTSFSSDPFLGDDLGAFARGDVDDDVPDIHARSVRPSAGERKADFVGGDCVDIIQKHSSGGQSGLFRVKPLGSQEVVELYCDQLTGLGGWALVQQREHGSVNFNRTWDEYRNGFGHVDQKGRGDFWLGNRLLHLLTQRESLLRVELQDWEGREVSAEYNVNVGPESEGFPLRVSSYAGDAGDALVQGQPNLGSYLSHNGMKFSTFDRDSDKWEENCAEMYGGGWWYNNCQSANLNGIYYKGGKYDPGSNIPNEIENGIVWLPFKPADYSLKVVRMKIRPA